MIRLAEVHDLPSIAELYHRVWHETHGLLMPCAERQARDEHFFLNRMAALMPNVVVGTADATVIGFAAWTGARLGQVFLDASARGSGAADRLMEAAESELRDQGVQDAELHCLVGNERAKRFYQRRGWRVGGIMAEPVRGDEGGESRDFWVMRKRLTRGASDASSPLVTPA